mgnify:CR=1 FL=1
MNFTQLVKHPPRITSNTVFSNCPVIELNVPSYAVSDQSLVAIIRKYNRNLLKKHQHNYILYKTVKHFDEEVFVNDLPG